MQRIKKTSVAYLWMVLIAMSRGNRIARIYEEQGKRKYMSVSALPVMAQEELVDGLWRLFLLY